MSALSGELRPVIAKALAVCVLVGAAPWMSGGQDWMARLITSFAVLAGGVLLVLQPVAPRLKRGPLKILGWAFIGFAALSLLWTASLYSSLTWIVQWVLAGLLFGLAYTAASSPEGRKWLLNGYLATSAVFAAVGVGMYLTSEYNRLTGTFYWANPAAAYLIPAIVIALDRVRRSGSGGSQYGWMGLVIALGTAFLLTDSRGASLILAVVLAIYLLVVKLSGRTWIRFLFITIMTCSLSFIFVKLATITVQHEKAAPGSRYSEAIRGESTSSNDRLYYLDSVFHIWLDRPVGGVGAGAYPDVHPSYQQRVISAATNAHNLYAQTAAELGLIGAGLMVALIIVLGYGLLRGIVVRPEYLAPFLGLIGLGVHFGLDIDARYPALVGVAALLAGLLYTNEDQEWVTPRKWWPAGALVVTALVAVWFISATWSARGEQAQLDGDYEVAADDFLLAQRGSLTDPDLISAEAINTLALAGGKLTTEDAETGLKLAREAQKLDSWDSQHYQLEGRILAGQGKLEEAEKAFRKALKLDPHNHPDYALDLARTLKRRGYTDSAVQVAKAMMAKYPPDILANRVADETLPPRVADLEVFLGNIYQERGDREGAKAAAIRAVELDEADVGARVLLRQTSEPR